MHGQAFGFPLLREASVWFIFRRIEARHIFKHRFPKTTIVLRTYRRGKCGGRQGREHGQETGRGPFPTSSGSRRSVDVVFQNVGRTECESSPRLDGHLYTCLRIAAHALSFVPHREGAEA